MIDRLEVRRGTLDDVSVYSCDFTALVQKADVARIERQCVIPEYLEGSHSEGEVVGEIRYMLDGECIGSSNVVLRDNIETLGLLRLFIRILIDSLT